MYPSSFALRGDFEAAEQHTQTNDIGLWDYTGEPPRPSDTEEDLVVWDVHEDTLWNDHENLNEENIEFKNTGSDPIDLSGWTVRDEADHIYHFPSGFPLDADAVVTLYTGSGTNTDTELYWGSGRAVWNNNGDTIILENDAGETVIEHKY